MIGLNAMIGDDADIYVTGNCVLGKNSNYGKRMKILCREIKIGDFMHAGDDINLGYGSSTQESMISIGNHCFLGHKMIINSEKSVEIGNDVGIGAEAMIWTHGAWLPILEGFPASFLPVKIGDRVWLPARTIVLPGAKIGNNVVISINSVVGGNIPDGALAAGNPARVIKEGMYPQKLSAGKKQAVVKEIFFDYLAALEDKGFNRKNSLSNSIATLSVEYKGFSVLLLQDEDIRKALGEINAAQRHLIISFNENGDRIDDMSVNWTLFDLSKLTMTGMVDRLAEDLRDYLRRRGIKIFTDKKFISIRPKAFEELNKL